MSAQKGTLAKNAAMIQTQMEQFLYLLKIPDALNVRFLVLINTIKELNERICS